MGPRGVARTKAAGTIVVLVLVLLVGVAWGWSAVREPFPEQQATPPCVDTDVAAGDPLRPAAITVSVLNAGGREGLARETMDSLVERGFDEGSLGNAPDDTRVVRVQVWTDDRDDPAARLVRSYLGRGAQLVEREGAEPGINIVVGPEFAGVVRGRQQLVLPEAATVCGPPEAAPEPVTE